MEKTLEFKWTVSRGRDTYGYNICTLYVDGVKVSRCNGGGYDMEGTCLGDWMAHAFKDELLKLTEKFYGLTFHDPTYNPGKAVREGETIEDREKAGKSLGLERYQESYSASSPIPTEKHVIPLLDGACGISSMETILRKLGYGLAYVPVKSKSLTIRRLYKRGPEAE